MTDEAPARRAEDPGRPDDLPPRLAGRFRLAGVLRETAGAVDHLAHDDLLDRAAVLTVAPVDAAHAPLLARAAGLDHPHLVPVIDLEVDGRDPDAPRVVVVTDPSDGGDLGTRLETGPLDVADVLICGAAVADALHHVHRAGLAHLGVGPASVLLDEEGRARLAGTGLALAAPGARVDAVPAGATDVRDLGALLLAALSHDSRGEGVTPVSPREVRRLLRRMTDDDPAARPAAAEVAGVLRHAALALTAVTPAPAPPRTVRVPRGVVAAAAVATAALLAGTVAAVVTSPVEEVAADAPGAAAPPAALVVPPGSPAPADLPDTGSTSVPDRTGRGSSSGADPADTPDAPAVDRMRGPRVSTDPVPAPLPAPVTGGGATSGTTTPSAPAPSGTTTTSTATTSAAPTSTTAPRETTPPARSDGLVGRLLTVARDAL